MADCAIYHNPRCSKSRQTLALLREHGHEPRVIRYLDTPPTRDELVDLLVRLGLAPRDILRAKEPTAGELGISAESDDEAILDALAAHPGLLERPIVVVGDRAALGRPPEAVLALF